MFNKHIMRVWIDRWGNKKWKSL